MHDLDFQIRTVLVSIMFMLTLLLPSTLFAAPKFLTLPFDSDRRVTSGWFYDDDQTPHQGIDYSTGTGLPILSASDGVARQSTSYDNQGYGYGDYVFISHSNGYFTLYAHLSDVESWIPATTTQATSTWASVSRREKIGESGSSGTDDAHLHFEARLDNYGEVKLREDPYDIASTSSLYPTYGEDFTNCGPDYLWTACPPTFRATVTKTGTISSDETWVEDNIYYLSGAVTIASGVTITVEPGTIVKFGTTGKLTVNGTLTATGTESQPIYFTSYKDDIGGDTNGDGSATTPAPGNWYEIIISTGGSATFEHTVTRFGGGASATYDANITNNGGLLMVGSTTIASSSNYGIRHLAGTSTIATSTIIGNYKGIDVSGSGEASVHGNIFSYNSIIGSITYSATLIVNLLANTVGLGNGEAAFEVSGTITDGTTWYEGTPYLLISTATVYSGSTLTIFPGTVVKFKTTSTGLIIEGTLYAEGLSDSLIYFTSYKDDSVGGDTNNDVIELTPASGDWEGIVVQTGGQATLDYAVVRYGGNALSSSGMISNDGTLSILNSELASSSDPAVYQNSNDSITTIATSTIHHVNYGILVSNGSISVTGSTFHHNPTAAILLNYNYGLQFTSSGNTAIPSSGSVAGIIANGDSLIDNQVWSKGIPYLPNGNITMPAGKTLTIEPGTVVKFKTTGSNLYISGTLEAEGTEAEPIYFTSYKDDVGGDTNGDGDTTPTTGDWSSVTINSGGVATLDRVVARYGGWLSSVPDSIIFNNGGTLTMHHTMILDGTTYGVRTIAGSTSISSSTITSMQSKGLDRYSSGSVTVSNSNIFDNGTYGAYSANSTMLNAENNYWGDASGPYHATTNPSGTGDTVSNYVDYTPWLNAEVSW